MFRGVEVDTIVITSPPIVESWEVQSHAEAVFGVSRDGDGTFGVNSDGFTVWSVK